MAARTGHTSFICGYECLDANQRLRLHRRGVNDDAKMNFLFIFASHRQPFVLRLCVVFHARFALKNQLNFRFQRQLQRFRNLFEVRFK